MHRSVKKVWFITGASAGFGRSFARYAAVEGYQVIATARTLDKLETLKALAPDAIDIIKMDVTSPVEVAASVAHTLTKYGRIDVVINNAGYGLVGAVEETSDEDLRAIMETNFFGAMNVIREVLPHLREQTHGAIVNITSLGGQLSIPGYSAYSASKFALEGVSEALHGELAPFNVKVLIVEPGSFRTEFTGPALKTMPSLDAYASTVGETKRATLARDQVQMGDPYKAAAAIDRALQSDTTPLRLQLGEDSIAMVKAHAENLLKDLAAWGAVGANTRID